MAEKRFIHRRFFESDKIRQLANEGKDRACFHYGGFLAHFDSAGRMNANPLLLKGSLFEGYTVTVEQIEASLFDMARVGLVILYRNGRHDWLIQCTKFLVEDGGFNRPHPKEPPSTIPGPDDAGSEVRVPPTPCREDSGKVPGVVRGEVEVYGEGESKGKVEEEHSSTSPDPLAAAPPFEDDPGDLAEVWNEHCGPLPAVRTLSTGRLKALRRFAQEYGVDARATLADATRAVATNDFWVRKQYTLDNLLAGDKVTRYAEQWRAGNIQLGDANLRMATQVDRWARALDAAPERPVN
jgi:hypothetical protein